MRPLLLLAILAGFCALAPMSAHAKPAPRYHKSSKSKTVYAPSSSTPSSSTRARKYPQYTPLWEFTDYPKGIPKTRYDPKKPGYRYYPYSRYRTSPPQGHYNRYKRSRYPVR